MGNDSSRLKGLVIDKTAVEANDFWTLYNAEMPTTSDDGKQLLSVFQGETVVAGQLWVTQGPMERAIKNFRIYRHPCILKYVATWEQGGQKHLATERVRPLIAEVNTLSDIQVCLGLRTILCSLIFLVEKAQARHLNICISSINIADDGSWRLAGFEYVWKSKELTKKLLDMASAYRYKAAIDPQEMRENINDCIEQYAFATLCEELLAKCTRTEIATPFVQEFRDYCATHLKHKNAAMRPKLSAVLLHPYFNHEFVLIHSFLIELPLKSLSQKQEFFTSLIDRLRCFNEDVVGAQFAELLLSRMVLLDPTAQLCVTPYVLKTKSDHSAALFSNQTYSHYLMPHIRRNFRVRDAQIRLILLEYFMEFVRLLPKNEIEEFVLPHLQSGMKDTNDILVAKTLRCLADLVPILGSAVVVGGERARLFSDGRPQAAMSETTASWVEPRSITPVMGIDSAVVEYMVSGSPIPTEHVENDLSSSLNSLSQTDAINEKEQLNMPPRLSPDGGEDDGLIHSITQSDQHEGIAENNSESLSSVGNQKQKQADKDDMEDEEVWSDWETDELQRLNGQLGNELETISNIAGDTLSSKTVNTASSQNLLVTGSSFGTLPSQVSLTDSYKTSQSASAKSILKSSNSKKINDDLSSLDIIVQKTATPFTDNPDEFDFFKDMQPVIEIKRSSTDNDKMKDTLTGSNNSISLPKVEASASDAIKKLKSNVQITEEEIKIDTSRFAAASTTTTEIEDGWGVDDEDVDWNAA